MAVWLGKMPTTLVHRLISPLRHFDRIGGVQLGPMRGRKAHECEHIRLGLVHSPGDFWAGRPQLVGDFAALQPGRFSVVLRKGGGDEGGDHAPAALACMGKRIAHEVNAAALPAGGQHLRHRCLDALMSIRVHQLDALQPAPPQLAKDSAQNVSASEGPTSKDSAQNVLASEEPMSMPSISRRPSLLTPTAMMAATDTRRPFWRTFT
jgi:hypothetical protein